MASTNKNWYLQFREKCIYRHKKTMCKRGCKCSMRYCFVIKEIQAMERNLEEHPRITIINKKQNHG